MSERIEQIGERLEGIALEVVTLEAGDIPALGNLMNALEALGADAEGLDDPRFLQVAGAVKGYLEKLILADATDLEPLEEGVTALQAFQRDLANGETPQPDVSGVLQKLGKAGTGPQTGAEDAGAETSASEQDAAESSEEPVEPLPSAADLSEEDRQILQDFVGESKENLEAIEVHLVNLEQEPEDLETVNSIFRPFHTIKGVSGFLNLKDVNKLSHSAENLLDKARNGDLKVGEGIIDLVLESVDTLKRMIDEVQEGLDENGLLTSTVDIAPLVRKIDMVSEEQEKWGDSRVGEILLRKGAITREDLDGGLERQKIQPGRKLGEILLEEKKTESKEVISALRDQRRYSKGHVDLQVKVDTVKLDNMVDLTGELVIAQSMLRQNPYITGSNDQKLYHNLGQLNQITSGLQRIAMSMRMVPIKSTFQKMVRLVRDLAKNSGKEVALEMSGEDTEIDRNVVDELYEPMVHMIRNAVDHGLESPDEREAAGKHRRGTVLLRAFHRGGNIVIEIEDDGRGLNREAILEKAISRGLIPEDHKLTDVEICNLIFHPGFSTAEKITDISGRGVGMDVVKKAIEKLRGRVEINTRPGRGSAFVINLPLTLAIIEGMLVRVGKQRYIIPALAILESFRPSREQYSTVEGKGELIQTRGSLVPLVRLHTIFGVESDFEQPWEGLVVAVEHEDRKMCLLLDELLGKEEVVIKSLGGGLRNIKGIAGGAILGDGRVGLILDMSGIFDVAQGNGRPSH
ncbi:MAG: chemotaxis protein CheA [Deltaproteobacteria bacterium]|nr:chemotaxis protein CheA [Deltaproteobacteria bacterium]